MITTHLFVPITPIYIDRIYWGICLSKHLQSSHSLTDVASLKNVLTHKLMNIKVTLSHPLPKDTYDQEAPPVLFWVGKIPSLHCNN